MQRSIYQHIVLEAPPTGGELKVVNRHLYINNLLIFKHDDVRRDQIVKETAITSETLGTVTFTVASATPAFSTTYAITLTIPNPGAQGADPNPIVKTISIVTPATGTLTPTTVDAQFVAKINADASINDKVVATGGATLVITAKAGYPIVLGNWNINPDSSADPVISLGVAKRGLVANMTALGCGTVAGDPNTIFASGSALTDTAYTLYYAMSADDIGENNTSRLNQVGQRCLWVAENAPNYAAFIADFDDILGGYLKDGVTTSEHQLEVNSKGGTQ